MLVSHRQRFIYTKTGKTAGTSVESYFEPWCFAPDCWAFSHSREESVSEAGIVGYRGPQTEGKTFYNHMPASRIWELVGDRVWNTYFKFCVIRNPFDKMVSAFHFAHRSEDTRDPICAFRAWVARGEGVYDRDQYTLKGQLALDDYVRYENLHDDLARICQKVGVPWEPERLPRLKSGLRPHKIHLKEYYDQDTIATILERFDFEFEHFGYAPMP